MYDPLDNRYGMIRHDEIMREAEAYWRTKLEAEARGENFRERAPHRAGLFGWVVNLLTALHR